MRAAPLLNFQAKDNNTLELLPSGSWTAAYSSDLEILFDAAQPRLERANKLTVDMAGVGELDTLGAWLLEKISRQAEQSGHRADLVGLSDRYADLIAEVKQVNRREPAARKPQNPIIVRLDQVGRYGAGVMTDVVIFLQMLGALGAALLGVIRNPRSLRFTSLAY